MYLAFFSSTVLLTQYLLVFLTIYPSSFLLYLVVCFATPRHPSFLSYSILLLFISLLHLVCLIRSTSYSMSSFCSYYPTLLAFLFTLHLHVILGELEAPSLILIYLLSVCFLVLFSLLSSLSNSLALFVTLLAQHSQQRLRTTFIVILVYPVCLFLLTF
jgi:hypothetical protein